MEMPSSLTGDASVTAALLIYAQSWELSTDKGTSAREAALKLHDLILEDSDAYRSIHTSIEALEKFACEAPSALDYGLDVFSQAAAKLPESWYLVDFSTFYQGSVPPFGIGKETTDDQNSREGSNITFQLSEVSNSKPVAVKKLQDFQRARLRFIILLAMQARCHSKGIVRLNRGEHVGDHAVVSIRNALDPFLQRSPCWSKVNFVGYCILLRGYAKSLIDVLPAEVGEGTNNLDGDFVVKIHAAKVLENLNNSPHDEDSSQLFALKDWVF